MIWMINNAQINWEKVEDTELQALLDENLAQMLQELSTALNVIYNYI